MTTIRRPGQPTRRRGFLPLVSWHGLQVACLATALLGGSIGGFGCRSAPEPSTGEPERPTILLITAAGLRADDLRPNARSTPRPPDPAVLAPSLTALMEEADWAGSSIAPAASTLPSAASLLTGLSPWRHQVLHRNSQQLAPKWITLPEQLASLGYRTAAYVSGSSLQRSRGFHQGFNSFRPYNLGGVAEGHVTSLDGTPTFLWVHLAEPLPPYVLRPYLRPRVGAAPRKLPQRLTRKELARHWDPELRSTPYQLQRISALYRFNIAWLDDQVGRLLEALKASGQWDDTWVIFTSLHGTELGEHGQIGHDKHLHREVIEVPLVIKRPRSSPTDLRIPAGERPSISRIWATVVEAAGGAAPPAIAPSLLRDASPVALSELYLANGTNLFSVVEGDLQLVREASFAAPEPDFYRALVAAFGGGVNPPLNEPPAAIFGRLERAFAATPPFTGGRDMPARQTLYRWGPDGGSSPVEGPNPGLDREIARAWAWFLDHERSPAEEKGRSMPREPIVP